MGETLSDLKAQVWAANMELHRSGLVLYTFGNVSGVDRSLGVLVIKPSGVPYHGDEPRRHGPRLARDGRRARDAAPTVVGHADARRPLPGISLRRRRPHPLRSRHGLRAGPRADPLHGHDPRRLLPGRRARHPATRGRRRSRPTTRRTQAASIVETFASLGIDPAQVRAILVANHGPFAWGADAAHAVENAVVLEFLARVDLDARRLEPGAPWPRPRARRQALRPQARPHRLLRPDEELTTPAPHGIRVREP